MKRRNIRQAAGILLLAASMEFIARAEESAITFDVRVFQVAKPITAFPFKCSEGSVRCATVSMENSGWTVESGLPLNAQGDVLYWDGEKSTSSPGITQLASKDGLANPTELAIDSGEPLQYLEARADGRFELKTSDNGQGFSIYFSRAFPFQTEIRFDDRLSAKRNPLPGVQLDVGEPKPPSNRTHVMLLTPPEQWGSFLILDTGRKELGYLLVFVRTHGQLTLKETGTSAAPEVKVKNEQFSLEWKFISIPPEVDAKLSGAFRLDPPGGVCVKEICAPGNPQPFASLGELTDWLNTVEGVELISAPRITTLTLRDHRAHARKEALAKVVMRSGAGTPAQQDSMFDFVKTSPIAASAFERLWQPGFGMIADFATYQESSGDNVKTDWSGISVLLTVDGCETPGTAIVDFAAVHRYRAPDTTTPRDRVEPLKRTGPEFERVTRQVPPPPVLESGIVSKATLNA